MGLIGIFFLILFVIIGIVGYIDIRNERVYSFRNNISTMCYEWSMAHINDESAYRWCYDHMPTYEQMLFSLKPLKINYWLPKETIQKIQTKK